MLGRSSMLRSAWTAAIFAAALPFACSYVLPAAWRAFRADPDDAPPAIARALDRLGIQVASLEQAQRRIITTWVQIASGVTRSRERYVIRWERDANEDTLTVYVRHEAQDQDLIDDGAPRWSSVYHEGAKEDALLDLVERELGASGDPESAPAAPDPS